MQTQLSATPLSPELQQKYDALASNIQQLGHLAIAFSGGVDSTLLLKVAHDVLGENAVAITARAQMIPAREVQEASDFCNIEHIRHKASVNLRFRSTGVEMPETLPLFVYCHSAKSNCPEGRLALYSANHTRRPSKSLRLRRAMSTLLP